MDPFAALAMVSRMKSVSSEVMDRQPEFVKQGMEKASKKASEEAVKIADGVAKGEIKNVKDLQKAVAASAIDAAKEGVVAGLGSAGLDSALESGGLGSALEKAGLSGGDVIDMAADKAAEKVQEKVDGAIDRKGESLAAQAAEFKDMTPCMGLFCCLCGPASLCRTRCNCLLTCLSCDCIMCEKGGCCCGCCKCKCCDAKGCACCDVNATACFFEMRAAFPGTSLKKVPCLFNVLGLTVCYRSMCLLFSCYCCKSILTLDQLYMKVAPDDDNDE